MAENTSRSEFSLHGITGALILVVLLLGILFYLISLALTTQQESSTKFYQTKDIRDINNLKMISTENKKYSFVDAKEGE